MKKIYCRQKYYEWTVVTFTYDIITECVCLIGHWFVVNYNLSSLDFCLRPVVPVPGSSPFYFYLGLLTYCTLNL